MRDRSLSTSTATSEPTFTEVASGIGYTRQQIIFSAPTSGPDWTCVQTGTIQFLQATSDWGVVTHFGVFDAEAIGAGNILYWGDIPGGGQNIPSGGIVDIPNGELKVRLD